MVEQAAPPVEQLASIQDTLRRLSPDGPPAAALLCEAGASVGVSGGARDGRESSVRGARRLVALPGSFNPPHIVHLALLRQGAATVQADAAVFGLSVRTVDKEQVSGMLLEDRLWLLCQLSGDLGAGEATGNAGSAAGSDTAGEAGNSGDSGGASGVGTEGNPGSGIDSAAATRPDGRPPPAPEPPASTAFGAVAINRGLYVEQVDALRRLCPALQRLTFVVGYDKIAQIFDPRYYQDRDVALERLFSQADFLVAPRDAHTLGDVARLLEQPQNRRFAGAVQTLPLAKDLAGVSSTDARERIHDGVATDDLLPGRVAAFVAATGCYAAPDGEGDYGRRAAALAAL